MSTSESRINELRTIRRSSSVKEIMSKFTGTSVPETLDAFNTRVRNMSKSERAMHRAMTKIANSPLGKQNSPPPKPGHAPPMPIEWSKADMMIILEQWGAALRKEKPYYLFNAADAVQALAAQNITEQSVSKAQWDEWEKAIETTVENQLLSLDVPDNVSESSVTSSTPASPSRTAAPPSSTNVSRPLHGDGIATDHSPGKENGHTNAKPRVQQELLGDGEPLPPRGLSRVFASQDDNRVEPWPLEEKITSDRTRSVERESAATAAASATAPSASPKPSSSSSPARQPVEEKRTPSTASKANHTTPEIRSETDDKSPKRPHPSQDSAKDRKLPQQSNSQGAAAEPVSTSKDRKKTTKNKATADTPDRLPSPSPSRSRPTDRSDAQLSPPKKGITVTQTKEWGLKSVSAHAAASNNNNNTPTQRREDGTTTTPSGRNGFIWMVAIAFPLLILVAMRQWMMIPTPPGHGTSLGTVDVAHPSTMDVHPASIASVLQQAGHGLVEDVRATRASEEKELAIVKETLFRKEELDEEDEEEEEAAAAAASRSSKSLKRHTTVTATATNALTPSSSNWKRPFQTLFRGIKQGLDRLVHKIFPWTNRPMKGRS